MNRPKGFFLLDPQPYEEIYPDDIKHQIAARVDLVSPPLTRNTWLNHSDNLAAVEVIFSGWGCPQLNENLLPCLPRLQVVFYGAGSIKQIVTPAFWQRGIQITTANPALSISVADMTYAQIILALKRYWAHVYRYQQSREIVHLSIPGTYHATVGLISLGTIARLVIERLKILDIHIIAYDPYLTHQEIESLGVRSATLREVFEQSDVISLHTPWLPETERMITGAHLASMKTGATFINTARGAIVCEEELVSVFQKRSDLTAILDVTYPEPPDPLSKLWTLPNVILSPHIAGAMGPECARLGEAMLSELDRWIEGQPLRWKVTQAQIDRIA